MRGAAGRRHRGRSDEGAAAAEFAMVMPAVVFVLLALLAAAAFGLTQVRAVDAARAGAREAARGEDVGQIRETSLERAGADARIEIRAEGSITTVTVEIAMPSPLGLIMRAPVSATAAARTEGLP